MGAELDIRPSRLLKGGVQPYALSWVASTDSLPWADTAGISTDPYDDIAVWFAHAYADPHTKDGNYAIWVGKVLGSQFPWLKVRLHAVAGLQPVRPGDPVELGHCHIEQVKAVLDRGEARLRHWNHIAGLSPGRQ